MSAPYVDLVKVSGSEDKSGPKYTLVYHVTSADPGDGPFTVGPYTGWSYGDPYAWGNDSDPRAVAISIDCQPIGSSKTDWEVTVEFGDPQFEDLESPLNAPPQVSWGFEDRRAPVERDATGAWIRNSAGDRFDEIVYADDFRRTLQITRNEASFPVAVADALGNRLNASTWQGYGAKLVKLKPITADRAYHNLIGGYWVVKYEFTFAPIAADWKSYILDAGIYEVVSGEKRRIVMDDGTLAASPVPLDGSGARLPVAGSEVFTEWELIPTANFALLNLDSVVLT